MSPWKHAQSSAKKWGGDPSVYADLHDWMDETKQFTGDWTHRALRHHAAGIQEGVVLFGHRIKLPNGTEVPVKMILERHVMEDCGFIPTVQDWLRPLAMNPEPWMLKVAVKRVEDLQAE